MKTLLKNDYHRVVGNLILLFPMWLTVQVTSPLWSEQLVWLEFFFDCIWCFDGWNICLLVWKDEMESYGYSCLLVVGVCCVAGLFASILSMLL